MKCIRVDLDEESYLWLERRARREHRSMAAVLHDLIVRFSGNDDGSHTWTARRPAAKAGKEDERLSRILGRPSPVKRRISRPSRGQRAK
jgi:hypothetical protein